MYQRFTRWVSHINCNTNCILSGTLWWFLESHYNTRIVHLYDQTPFKCLLTAFRIIYILGEQGGKVKKPQELYNIHNKYSYYYYTSSNGLKISHNFIRTHGSVIKNWLRCENITQKRKSKIGKRVLGSKIKSLYNSY